MNIKVSTSDITELRERTGVGLSDCKKALVEAEGDLDKATELLRQKGLASVAKKAGKIAAEGAVISKVEGNIGVMIELNSQTDFVAKNDKFVKLVDTILDTALNQKCPDLSTLLNAVTSSGESVQDIIAVNTAQIGEKLELRRYMLLEAQSSSECLFSYTHPIGSKIAVLGLMKLVDSTSDVSENQREIAKGVAMHIAANIPQPEYLERNEVPQDIIDKETEIEMGKDDLSGKPEDIRQKIVTGRVEKALLSKVLLEQDFVRDPSKKIKEFVSSNGLLIQSFSRYNLGEGIEKKEVSFADEVAAQTQVVS